MRAAGVRAASSLAALDAFLQEAGIEHFRAYEICPVGRRSPEGHPLRPAPARLWSNVIETLHIVEDLRAATGGHPIGITSGYRDPTYNRHVGGAPHSLHRQFGALDVWSTVWTPGQVYEYLLGHDMADALGLGRYPAFTHVDTRGLLGREAPARW